MSDAHKESPLSDSFEETAQLLRSKLARELEDEARPERAPRIADHQLLQRVGSGSYGDVWLARSVLGTLRAVKIVYRARFKEDRPFEREFQGIVKYEPISRTHEGLLQILHVGRDDGIGCFFYVMELADDTHAAHRVNGGGKDASGTLADYRPRTLASDLARRERIPAAEAANIALQLARALGHLHRRGLVHRDVKPSNVVFVDGKPKLADIGLVTDVGSSRSFVGTEGFIPPEGPGAPQADLYGLGKLLYELATGRDRLDFPQLPARLEELPEGEALLELNEVITRACTPEVEDRYALATELEGDLNSFLGGRSLRRARNLERYLSRLRKAVAVSCVFLAVLAAALWISWREERHARETARAANERAQLEIESRQKERDLRLRAETAEREAQEQLYKSLLEQARANVRSGLMGQRVQSLEALKRAASISNHVDLRREAIAALGLPDLRVRKELPYNNDFNLCLFDPALARVALSRGRGPVEIRSVHSNELITSLPASTNLVAWGGTWSQDGRFLAIKRDYEDGGYHADVEVWEVDRSRRVLLIREARFNARTFHPTEPRMLVSEADGWISAWDLEAGKEIGRRKFATTAENLAYSPDGKFVAASYRTEGGWALSVHESEGAAMLSSMVLTNVISTFSWHPDRTCIAVCDYGGRVHLMDVQNGTVQTLGRHKAQAATATFDPTGEYLVTGGWERELICWNVGTRQRELTIVQDSYVAQFSSDGRSCALLRPSGVILTDFERSSVRRQLFPEMGAGLWNAVFSPDGRFLAAAAESSAGVWDLESSQGGVLKRVPAETRLYWSLDSRELLGSSRGSGAFRWQVSRMQEAGVPVELREIQLKSPDGFTSIAGASNWVTWTSLNGSQRSGWVEPANDWVPTEQGLNGISPDGKWLGIYQPYGVVLSIYELPEIRPVAALTNLGSIAGFNFLPGGEELVVASRGHLEFWSTKGWERTRVARGFIGIAHLGVLPQPDGRALWLLNNYQTAGLYERETLERILSLPNGMLPLALDRQGRYLAVSVDAQRLEVWDVQRLREEMREAGIDWEDR